MPGTFTSYFDDAHRDAALLAGEGRAGRTELDDRRAGTFVGCASLSRAESICSAGTGFTSGDWLLSVTSGSEARFGMAGDAATIASPTALALTGTLGGTVPWLAGCSVRLTGVRADGSWIISWAQDVRLGVGISPGQQPDL